LPFGSDILCTDNMTKNSRIGGDNKVQLEDFFRVIKTYLVCNECGHTHDTRIEVCERCSSDGLFAMQMGIDPTGDSHK